MAKNTEGLDATLNEEARRRADIVRRYVALARPSPLDDQRFAEELGLSVDSLLRLAAAWRSHPGPAVLRGARTGRPKLEGREGSEIMAEEIDMTGVDPHRRDEILRRIRIVQRYLSADASNPLGRLDAAHEMGVSANRFDAVVRQWTLHRRASLMPGATVKRPRWHRLSQERERVHEILREIALACPDATINVIQEMLKFRCSAEGLKPLGKSQTHLVVRTIRSERRGGNRAGRVSTDPLPSPPPRRTREAP